MSDKTTVRLTIVSRRALPDVQRVLDQAPSYHELVMGKRAPSDLAQRMYEHTPPQVSRDRKHLLAIRRLPDDAMIGVVDVVADMPRVGTAIIGLLLIRESEQRCGYGSQAMTLLKPHLLERHPHLEWLRIGVTDDNHQALRFWNKIGFEATDDWFDQPFGNSTKRVVILRQKI